MPFYVAEMEDECILEIDFLSKTEQIRNFFEKIFGSTEEVERKKEQVCSRMKDSSTQLPNCLSQIEEQNSLNLDSSQRKIFAKFLFEFCEIFSENIVVGSYDMISYRIKLNNFHPIKQTPRRIPLHLQKEVDEILEEMKAQGVIEESNSPWVSPAVLVKKKEGTIRFCVDFRKLNAETIKDSYPLPRIDDILDNLAGNSCFCTLDLKSGYWQVRMDPKDREKTAFSIGKGLWQFTVMPFGLCNAPATFERLMEIG